MPKKFSVEVKEIIARARDIAIELGYDYISTIHFFLADCESKRQDSILKFSFKDEIEYQSFKKSYGIEKKDYLNFIDVSLPLTREAEITIRLSLSEKKLQKHKLVLPSHLFIAALKNQDSLLFEFFKEDKNRLENLINYYKGLYDINTEKQDAEENNNKVINQGNTNFSLLYKIKKTLGLNL